MEELETVQSNLDRFKLLTEKILVSWNDYEFFLDFVVENINYYLKSLPSYEGYLKDRLVENQDNTICLCNKIIEAIGHYFKGKVVHSYEDMKQAFSCIKDILARKSSSRYTFNGEFGFRGAVIKPTEPVPSRARMFHMPFENRHLVQDFRYSIHGLPSIYLGRSIYACYLELNCPSLDNFWVSLFNFSQDPKSPFGSKQYISLIDLTICFEKHKMDILISHVKNDEESLITALDQLANDILLWPLIMVCSIPCKYPDASFKQEYIIPQILYQLCSDYDEHIGIKYISTKAKYFDGNNYPHPMENYALPAHDARKAGYCPKLASKLVLTTPITASMCNTIEIESNNGYSSLGFPIISSIYKIYEDDKTILLLDKMTTYFDKLIHSIMEDRKIELLTPLFGW